MPSFFAQSYVDLPAIQPSIPVTFSTPDQIVTTIFNFSMLVAGILFVVLILIAGSIYLFGAGNDDQTGKAKRMLTQGTIGLFITLSAWAGGQFILSKLFGRSPMGRPGTGQTTPPATTPPPTSSPSPTATVRENLATTITVTADGSVEDITVYVLPADSTATSIAELDQAALTSSRTDTQGRTALNFNYTVVGERTPHFRVVLVRGTQRFDTNLSAIELEDAQIAWPFPAGAGTTTGEAITARFAFATADNQSLAGVTIYVLPEGTYVSNRIAAEANKLGSGAVDANGRATVTFRYTPTEGVQPRFQVTALRDSQSSGAVLTAAQLRSGLIPLDWPYGPLPD